MTEAHISKRWIPLMFGLACLSVAILGTLKTWILQTQGIETTARITSIRKVRHYSSFNRLQPDDYEVQFIYQDREGNAQTLDARLGSEEKNRWIIDGVPTATLFYVPNGQSYAVGERPKWVWVIIGLSLLMPLAGFCFYSSWKAFRS